MSHLTMYVFYIGVLMLSFGIVYGYRKWALKRSILDIPNKRSSHIIPVPRGGGIGIVMAFYLGLLFLFLNKQIERDLFYALLPGIGIALTGIIDDFKGLAPIIRITAQFLCAGLALFFLHGFHPIIGSNFEWLWFVLALVGSVWFINLFNFLDGSDGYASMEAIFIAIALFIFSGMNVLLLLAFSIGGFLYWNWPRAKIFMGDAGSTTLGFIIVVVGTYLHNSEILHFSFWILITSLFWFDATVTLIRRIFNREKLSIAHKNHMYQRTILGGFSHLKTMISGLVINIFLFLICLVIWKDTIPFLFGSLITLALFGVIMIYVEKLHAFNK